MLELHTDTQLIFQLSLCIVQLMYSHLHGLLRRLFNLRVAFHPLTVPLKEPKITMRQHAAMTYE